MGWDGMGVECIDLLYIMLSEFIYETGFVTRVYVFYFDFDGRADGGFEDYGLEVFTFDFFRFLLD
jgi:hypothetical protein